jgi:hypothetical protein
MTKLHNYFKSTYKEKNEKEMKFNKHSLQTRAIGGEGTLALIFRSEKLYL